MFHVLPSLVLMSVLLLSSLSTRGGSEVSRMARQRKGVASMTYVPDHTSTQRNRQPRETTMLVVAYAHLQPPSQLRPHRVPQTHAQRTNTRLRPKNKHPKNQRDTDRSYRKSAETVISSQLSRHRTPKNHRIPVDTPARIHARLRQNSHLD